jgi:hypothetical protein
MGNVVAYYVFEDGAVTQLEMYPGTWESPDCISEVGMPQRATGETAKEIIADVTAFSKSYGTDVQFEDGTGIVSLE